MAAPPTARTEPEHPEGTPPRQPERSCQEAFVAAGSTSAVLPFARQPAGGVVLDDLARGGQ